MVLPYKADSVFNDKPETDKDIFLGQFSVLKYPYLSSERKCKMAILKHCHPFHVVWQSVALGHARLTQRAV